jgi:hypothetical protein
MSIHFLVISNPPHGSVDAAKAAVYFDMTPAEARMKMNFAAPEVWFTDSDQERMVDVQSSLAGCGVNTVVLEGQDLLAVPEQYVVQSFSMGDSQIVAKTGEGEFTVDYAAPVAGVYCKPAANVFMGGHKGSNLAGDWGRPSSSVMLDRMSRSSSSSESESESAGSAAFLDLYTSLDGEDRRFSFIAGATDFSSLESVGRDPVHALVAMCERSLSALSLDRRLENVRVRARAVVGQPLPGEEQRKLFSFGSLALAKLLDDISPELHDLTQNELGSRLSYLMK